MKTEDVEKLIKMFPDLPDPEQHPKIAEYCAKLFQHLNKLKNSDTKDIEVT